VRRAAHCYTGTGCTGRARIVVVDTGLEAAATVAEHRMAVVAPRPEVVAGPIVVVVHIELMVAMVEVVAPTAVDSDHYS